MGASVSRIVGLLLLNFLKPVAVAMCIAIELENHCHSLSLYFTYHNFCRIRKSLSVTPVMQAGLIKRVMTIEDIPNLVPIPSLKTRGSYKETTKGAID